MPISCSAGALQYATDEDEGGAMVFIPLGPGHPHPW